MEVEMTQKEGSILNDFNKLLQAEADYKIMVFQFRKKTRGKNKNLTVEKMFDFLKKATKDYRPEYKPKLKSKYLLCCWDITDFTFKFMDFER